MGEGQLTPIFLVQVKSTAEGYTVGDHRLKVQVSEDEMQGLASFPVPVYIIGIDEAGELGYILSANKDGPSRISSLATTYSIDRRETLESLWNEVKGFWSQYTMRFTGSVFSE